MMGLANMAGGFLGRRSWPPRPTEARSHAAHHLRHWPGGLLQHWFLYNPNIPWLQVFASGSIAFTAAGFYMMDQTIGAGHHGL